MKRILSFALAFMMILSLSSISYAEGKATSEIEKKYEVLTSLNIVNLRDKEIYTGAHGESDVFRNMSKTAFINYVCNIVKGYGFTDTYSEDAVKVAEELGLIHKNQTDLNKPLYYDEAFTRLVRLLGYGTHAEALGGFPDGYISIANRLGLTEGISAKRGEIMQEFDAISLLYNTINAPYVDIASITKDGIVYGNASETSCLYEFRNIYRVDGVLEGTKSSSITTAHKTPDGFVMINGYLYQTNEDFFNILGMNVEAYVQENNNGDSVLICAVPSRNEEMTIYPEDIIDISDDITKLEYADENNREKSILLSPVVNVIYNGQPIDIYTKDDFRKADGEIRLVSNDNDREIEVIFIMDTPSTTTVR